MILDWIDFETDILDELDIMFNLLTCDFDY